MKSEKQSQQLFFDYFEKRGKINIHNFDKRL